MNRFRLLLIAAVVGGIGIGGAILLRRQQVQRAKEEAVRKAVEEREAKCKPVLADLTTLWVQHRPRAVDGSLAGMNIVYCYQEIYYPALCGIHQECIAACGQERCSAVGEAIGDSLGAYFHGRGERVCKDFPPSHLSTDKTLREYCAQAIGVRVR